MRLNNSKLKSVFYVFLLLIIFISLISAITLEEELLARNDGLDFDSEIEIGEPPRVFTPVNGKGFVQIKDGNFIVKNSRITTQEGIDLTTGSDSMLIKFGTGNIDSSYQKYVQIYDEGNGKKIKTNNEDVTIKAENSKIVLDNEGDFEVGTRFMTFSDMYVLGGYSLNLLENSEVNYLGDRIEVTLPGDSLVIPIVEDSEKVKGRIEIKTKESSSVNTPWGRFQTFASPREGKIDLKQTSFFYEYENGKLFTYTEDPLSVYYANGDIIDFSVLNPNVGTSNPRMYFAYDINNIDSTKPTLLVGENSIGSINGNGAGPIINLGKGNRAGVGLDVLGNNRLQNRENTVSFQSFNGYAIAEKGNLGEISTLRLNGNSIYGPDKLSIYYDEATQKSYYNKFPRIEHVQHGDGSVPLQVSFFDDFGNSILGYDIISNVENQHVTVPHGSLGSPFKYFATEGGIVSANVAFNQLSPKTRKLFAELDTNVQSNLYNQFYQQGSLATLEREIIKNSIPRPNNPIDSNTHDLINKQRRRSVKWDPKIAAVAKQHSDNMARRGQYLGHSGSGGRFAQVGGSVSENVAYFTTYDTLTPEQVGQRFTNMWMSSRKGHRENILNPSWTRTGLAISHTFDRGGRHAYYATQLFAVGSVEGRNN